MCPPDSIPANSHVTPQDVVDPDDESFMDLDEEWEEATDAPQFQPSTCAKVVARLKAFVNQVLDVLFLNFESAIIGFSGKPIESMNFYLDPTDAIWTIDKYARQSASHLKLAGF